MTLRRGNVAETRLPRRARDARGERPAGDAEGGYNSSDGDNGDLGGGGKSGGGVAWDIKNGTCVRLGVLLLPPVCGIAGAQKRQVWCCFAAFFVFCCCIVLGAYVLRAT